MDIWTEPTQRGQLIFMVAHHLAVDLVSWRIILNDLENMLSADDTSKMPRSNMSMSFQTWLNYQREQAQKLNPVHIDAHESPAPMLDYWTSLSSLDTNTFGQVVSCEFTLDSHLTTQLQEQHMSRSAVSRYYGYSPRALLHAFRQTFHDRPLPAIFVEGHGREFLRGTTQSTSRPL